MVPKVLASAAAEWQGHRVICYIDSTSALYSVVKGSCKHQAVNMATAVAHFFLCVFDIPVWWAFVDNKANWSGDVSRKGHRTNSPRRKASLWLPYPTLHTGGRGTYETNGTRSRAAVGEVLSLQSSGGARW